jgi:uncharacterized protein with HEPN domain
MRDPKERLQDILDAIVRIERYAVQGKAAFEDDELVQNWIVRHLQIIGEASRVLPDDLKKQAPAVPWSKIIGMRHIIVHDYFYIDFDVVWEAVEKDLPFLRDEINNILKRLD